MADETAVTPQPVVVKKTWVQRCMEGVFILDGKAYVGMATAITFLNVFMDRFEVGSKKTPDWWTGVPYGVYFIILVVFAGSKSLDWYVNSKFNSPPGQPPAK